MPIALQQVFLLKFNFSAFQIPQANRLNSKRSNDECPETVPTAGKRRLAEWQTEELRVGELIDDFRSVRPSADLLSNIAGAGGYFSRK